MELARRGLVLEGLRGQTHTQTQQLAAVPGEGEAGGSTTAHLLEVKASRDGGVQGLYSSAGEQWNHLTILPSYMPTYYIFGRFSSLLKM